MMVKKMRILGAIIFAAGICATILPANGQEGAAAFKIRLLASESVLYKSPDAHQIYLATPGIAVCPNGRLVATFHVSGKKDAYNKLPGVEEGGRCFIFTSDDDGERWIHRANASMYHARPFVAALFNRRLQLERKNHSTTPSRKPNTDKFFG